MKGKIPTEPDGTVTYTIVAYHISTVVSELLDYLSGNSCFSGVDDQQNRCSGNYHILNAFGAINTGHYADWIAMGAENCKKVNNEYACLRFGKGK